MMNRNIPGSVRALLAMGAPADFALRADAGPDLVVDDLQGRMQALLESQSAIVATADEEKRSLTIDEGREMDELSAEFERLRAEVERRERVAAQAAHLSAPRGRQTEAAAAEAPATAGLPQGSVTLAPPARVPASPRARAGGNGGFYNFGDFARVVRAAAVGQETDQRLRVLGAANESVGADGGFLVPPDFRAEINRLVFGEDSLVAMTNRISSSSNSITLPVDVTSPWDQTAGIQAYWTNEGATITDSKPVFEDLTVRAHKLAVLVPVTEELYEDAPALDGYLRTKVPEKMDFAISNALVRGNGVGKPLGFLNSGALVTVAKESAQTASTVVAANITKMWAAMPLNSRRTAVWLIHPDVESQLPQMTIGGQPVYMPPGGLSGAPYGTLMGRPVIPHQVAEELGTVGDIMLVDFNQYMTLTRTGGGRDSNGARTDVSMHLYFDQDKLAYRTTIRIGGQSWWGDTMLSRSGSFEQSPFVVLAGRS